MPGLPLLAMQELLSVRGITFLTHYPYAYFTVATTTDDTCALVRLLAFDSAGAQQYSVDFLDYSTNIPPFVFDLPSACTTSNMSKVNVNKRFTAHPSLL